MSEEEYFTVDWPYIKGQAREALRIYFAPLKWFWRYRRITLPLLGMLLALALSACAHTQYLTRSCISAEQYNQLKAAEPPKIHNKLTGKADEDTRPLAGSILELRAWGDTLLETLRICSEPPNK